MGGTKKILRDNDILVTSISLLHSFFFFFFLSFLQRFFSDDNWIRKLMNFDWIVDNF